MLAVGGSKEESFEPLAPFSLLQELQISGINFKAFDLGGHEIARRIWKDYYAKVWCACPGKFSTRAPVASCSGSVVLIWACDTQTFHVFVSI